MFESEPKPVKLFVIALLLNSGMCIATSLECLCWCMYVYVYRGYRRAKTLFIFLLYNIGKLKPLIFSSLHSDKAR